VQVCQPLFVACAPALFMQTVFVLGCSFFPFRSKCLGSRLRAAGACVASDFKFLNACAPCGLAGLPVGEWVGGSVGAVVKCGGAGASR